MGGRGDATACRARDQWWDRHVKAVHRVLGILSFALMLWTGATGSTIQLLDLNAILSGAPESSPTMQSINEGKFGDFFDYETATAADLSAQPLPASLDYARAFQTVLSAANKQMPKALPNFVELRMKGTTPIGQVRFSHDVEAFDAATGMPVLAVAIDPLFAPYSLRQRVKQLHRLWFSPEQPGIYFDLMSGIIMWSMIVTGLVTYFRLLGQRRRAGRQQLFWSAGGSWRAVHRGVALVAGVFLIAVAFSGTWIAFESVWHAVAPRAPHAEPANLTDAEILPMALTTLAAMNRTAPGVRIKALRVRIYAGFKQGVVVTDEKVTRQFVFDTVTGKSLDVDAPGYPASGFPAGRSTHEWIKHFHSGYQYGLPARSLDLFAGLSLVFLSASGLIMYGQMWRNRRKIGRTGLVWR